MRWKKTVCFDKIEPFFIFLWFFSYYIIQWIIARFVKTRQVCHDGYNSRFPGIIIIIFLNVYSFCFFLKF